MRIIEGRTRRTGSNRLAMSFHDIDVPDLADPQRFEEVGEFGEARQSGNDGKGRTLQIMLGWRDGGPGRHTLTLAGGREILVENAAKDGTVVSSSDGTELARIAPEDPAVAYGADGQVLFRFDGDPTQEMAVRELAVLDPGGDPVAHIQVSYNDHAWKQISVAKDVARAAVGVAEEIRSWSGSGSAALKLKIAGTRLRFERPVVDAELTVLLAVCVDIAIGYRRYISALRRF